MIQSFRDKKTARFAAGERVKAFSGFARQAEIRLDRLEAYLHQLQTKQDSTGPAMKTASGTKRRSNASATGKARKKQR